MADQVVETVYFGSSGEGNTDRTLELARKRAEELGIKSIVVASTSGATGLKAARLFQGYNVIVVRHFTGFSKPNYQEMSQENRAVIEAAGAKVLTCSHALSGMGRAVFRKFNTMQAPDLIANTLRSMFCQGMKVAVEIALMAADAGLVRTDEEIVAIGGTGGGADTAVVLKPANTWTFFDLHIAEVICKPRLP